MERKILLIVMARCLERRNDAMRIDKWAVTARQALQGALVLPGTQRPQIALHLL